MVSTRKKTYASVAETTRTPQKSILQEVAEVGASFNGQNEPAVLAAEGELQFGSLPAVDQHALRVAQGPRIHGSDLDELVATYENQDADDDEEERDESPTAGDSESGADAASSENVEDESAYILHSQGSLDWESSENGFVVPRITAKKYKWLVPERMDTKYKFFPTWFDLSEDEDQLGPIPGSWVKKEEVDFQSAIEASIEEVKISSAVPARSMAVIVEVPEEAAAKQSTKGKNVDAAERSAGFAAYLQEMQNSNAAREKHHKKSKDAKKAKERFSRSESQRNSQQEVANKLRDKRKLDEMRSMKKAMAGIKIKAPFIWDGKPVMDTFDHWTYEVDTWIELTALSDKLAMKLIVNFMSGTASKFFMDHVATNLKQWTIKDVYKALFDYCFPTDFKLRLRKRLMSAYQGKKTVRDFIRDIRSLAKRFPDAKAPKQKVSVGVARYDYLNSLGLDDLAKAKDESSVHTDSVRVEDSDELPDPSTLDKGIKGQRSFDVCNLDAYDIVLGTPFLFQHKVAVGFNPTRVVIGSMTPQSLEGDTMVKIISAAAEVLDGRYEDLRRKIRAEVADLCQDPAQTALPPFRAVNHIIPIIDDTKAKKEVYLRSGRWRIATGTNAIPMLILKKTSTKAGEGDLLPRYQIWMEFCVMWYAIQYGPC
ncbi:hypothetical protein B0H14DRAFT_3482147 [Mycena olivaceomarginata]|nr:hypothetical protein B0H14DRAFT_3482147 [Mycena olivaceomarginata]